MAGEAPPDIYLRFSHSTEDGALWNNDLQGESVDLQAPGLWPAKGAGAGYGTGWFLVTSFQFSISAEKGASGGASAPHAAATKNVASHSASGTASGSDVFKGVSVTMPLQFGCLYLMEACVKWAQKQQKDQEFEKIPKATLLIRRAGLTTFREGQSGQDWFARIVLEEVTVENYSMNSSCVQETFTLNYEDLSVEYQATDPETRNLGEIDGYNCVKWSNNAEKKHDLH